MKAFLRTVRRLSHRYVNTQSQQPSRREGILAPQSEVQNEVRTQSTARRVWDRAETDKKSVCVFECVGKFLLVTRGWGKTAWLQFPAKAGKQLLEGGRREGTLEREGGGEGLVWSTLKVFPKQCKTAHSFTDAPPGRLQKTVERNVDKHTSSSPTFAD